MQRIVNKYFLGLIQCDQTFREKIAQICRKNPKMGPYTIFLPEEITDQSTYANLKTNSSQNRECNLVNFGRFLKQNCAQMIWAIFSRKKCFQRQKISPKWRNCDQSGHTGLIISNSMPKTFAIKMSGF
jgi:hypothetical protein